MKIEWQNFPAKKDYYYSMLDYVMKIAKTADMNDDQQMRLELGFEEAAVNIIDYAYKGHEEGKIYLRAYRDNENFIIELKDSGTPFNPLNIEQQSDKPTTIEEAKIGGFGISFMQRIFNEMTYHYGKDGELFYNHLKLGMKLKTK